MRPSTGYLQGVEDTFYPDLLAFASEVLKDFGERAVAVCPVEGDYSYLFAPTKQRARQEGLKLSRENDATSFVVVVEQGEARLYVAAVPDAGGWRALRNGLERPVIVGPLPFHTSLGSTKRGRLSSLAV
jgi:hypothetical protein